MIARLKNSFLDYLGISASLLCAIHCAMLPFLVSVSVIPAWLGLHNHVFDVVILIIAAILIKKTIYDNYRKTGKPLALYFAITGIVLIILAKLIHIPSMIFISVLGGLLIATAHFIKIGQSEG